jgi:HAD superfamily hydrolase (TIGR01509 family)
MIKAVIFDCDGVIVNSEPIRYKAYQKLILKKFGKILPDKYYEEMLGRRPDINMEKFLSYIGIEGDVQKLLEEREGVIDSLFSEKENIIPMEGIFELIEKVEKEYVLAVASSSSKVYLSKILDALGVFDKFKVVVSGEMVPHSKPSPDIFLLTAERLGVNPGECLVIEDSVHGVIGAKKAGMKCVALASDLTKEKLSSAGADFTVSSLAEINV